MAVERLYFELATRRFVDAAGGALNSLDGKRGDRRRFELAVRKDGVPRDLPDATLRLSVKDPAAPSGGYLATAIGDRSGSAVFTRWFFDLDLNTTELTARLAAATSAVALALELEIVQADQVISSVSLQFSVEPDLNRGGEGTPASAAVKIYRALLTQTGTNAPVATVLENTFGATIVWSYSAEGEYLAALAGAFPASKTFLLFNRFGNLLTFSPVDANTLRITSTDGDGVLSNHPVEIRVYP